MAICAGWCRESGHLARRQGHPSVVVLHARRKSYFRQVAKRVHYVRDRTDSRKWFRIKFQHGDPTRARRQQSACASASRAGTVRGQSYAARIERPRAQYYREHDRRFVAVDSDWRFTYLNPKAYELLQAVRQSQEELVGQNMWLAFPELVGSAVARRQPSAATVSHAACFT